MQGMLDRGISTRRGVMNSHLERPYQSAVGGPLPQSEHAQQHGIILPLAPSMTMSQIDIVCAALAAALDSER